MTNNNNDYDYLFKLLLIGNTSSGKSSLLVRFADNMFSQTYLPTIGVDFKISTLQLNDKTLKLQIWDTAGQERFKTITSAYYKGAHGIIVTYDITDKGSFHDVENWLAEVDKHCTENVSKLLVGNKSDLEEQRQVSRDEGKAVAEKLGMNFIETSARDGTNVSEMFKMIAQEIFDRVYVMESGAHDTKPIKEGKSLVQRSNSTVRSKGCC